MSSRSTTSLSDTAFPWWKNVNHVNGTESNLNTTKSLDYEPTSMTVLIFIAQLLEIETFKHPYLPLLPPQFLNFSLKTAKSTAECLQQRLTTRAWGVDICRKWWCRMPAVISGNMASYCLQLMQVAFTRWISNRSFQIWNIIVRTMA